MNTSNSPSQLVWTAAYGAEFYYRFTQCGWAPVDAARSARATARAAVASLEREQPQPVTGRYARMEAPPVKGYPPY